MGFDPVSAIGSAVVSNVVGKALGGGKTTSRPTSTAPEQVAGTEFQPFTYTGSGGTVTGTQVGDYGYEWSADLPSWMTELGAGGADVAGGLFEQYYKAAQQDPYAAAQEFYDRGLAQLQPEFAKQQIQAQERMFGGGRLGLKLAGAGLGAPAGTGAVSPDAFGLGAAQSKALTDLYRTSLSEGQAVQTNRLNQLSQAAEAAKNLGMLPMMTEMDLIKFAKDLEIARSNAPKTYTQQLSYAEPSSSIFAGQIGNLAGQAAPSLFNAGSTAATWDNYGGSYGTGFFDAGGGAEAASWDLMPFESLGTWG